MMEVGPAEFQGGGKGVDTRTVTVLIPVDKNQRPFKCGLCSLAFDYVQQLDSHVTQHALTKPFQCGFCMISYDNSSELMCHVDTHQLFMCVAKGKLSRENVVQVKAKDTTLKVAISRGHSPVSRNTRAQQHKCASKQPPPPPQRESPPLYNPRKRGGLDCQCAQCGLKFLCQADLKKHSVSAHADDRPFHCRQCPARFKQNIHLKDHAHSVHGSHRPFACHLCGVRFKIRNYLRNHLARKHPDPSTSSSAPSSFSKKVKRDGEAEEGDDSGGDAAGSAKRAAIPREMETETAERREEVAEDSGGNSSDSGDDSDTEIDDNHAEEEDEDEEGGRTGEDDEALPHSFLTTSLDKGSDSLTFSRQQLPALWTMAQGQMKVEMDSEACTSRGVMS